VAKHPKHLFESDRKMELKLRLALKQAVDSGGQGSVLNLEGKQPPKELVTRLIAKVRKL